MPGMPFQCSLKGEALRLLRLGFALSFYPSPMTLEEIFALVQQRKAEMPEGKSTTELLKKAWTAWGKSS